MPSPSYTMPTQRPFFSNFLAAFRAHSALRSTPSASASAPTSASTAAAFSSQATHFASGASPATAQAPLSPTTTRALPAKTHGPLASAAAAAFSPPAHPHTHATHSHRNPAKGALATSPYAHQGSPGAWGGRRRRESDSSSDGGFRDALAGEKWLIGGRTGQGEERFYQLSMVRRESSGDRASCDRMSL